jgi:hypothetical protein
MRLFQKAYFLYITNNYKSGVICMNRSAKGFKPKTFSFKKTALLTCLVAEGIGSNAMAACTGSGFVAQGETCPEVVLSGNLTK